MGHMTDERKEFIRKHYTLDELLNKGKDILTLTECQEVIDETRLTKEDREIAKMWVIDYMTCEEIAEKLNIGDKRTIQKRLDEGNKKKDTPAIRTSLKSTLIKIICATNDRA